MANERAHIGNFQESLKIKVISLFEEWGVAKENYPKMRWIKLGQSIVFRNDWMLLFHDDKNSRLKQISEIFNAPIIAIRGVSKGRERRPKTKIIYGLNQKIIHRENGIQYVIDLEKTMFSAGNVSERNRIGKMNASGEVIIDFFAGIGYYSIPLLIHGGAKSVHAIDLSKDALDCLNIAGELNQISNRLTLHHGDISKIVPHLKIKADRIIMGLLPSGLFALDLALDSLQPTGGILHIHDTIVVLKHEKISTQINLARKKIKTLFRKYNHWEAEIVHIEKVKWWATRRKHVVYDIKISPRQFLDYPLD